MHNNKTEHNFENNKTYANSSSVIINKEELSIMIWYGHTKYTDQYNPMLYIWNDWK